MLQVFLSGAVLVLTTWAPAYQAPDPAVASIKGTFDLVNFDPGQPTQAVGCPGVGDLAIRQGNYIVHDDLLDLSAFNLLLGQFEAAAGDPYGSG